MQGERQKEINGRRETKEREGKRYEERDTVQEMGGERERGRDTKVAQVLIEHLAPLAPLQQDDFIITPSSSPMPPLWWISSSYLSIAISPPPPSPQSSLSSSFFHTLVYQKPSLSFISRERKREPWYDEKCEPSPELWGELPCIWESPLLASGWCGLSPMLATSLKELSLPAIKNF